MLGYSICSNSRKVDGSWFTCAIIKLGDPLGMQLRMKQLEILNLQAIHKIFRIIVVHVLGFQMFIFSVNDKSCMGCSLCTIKLEW